MRINWIELSGDSIDFVTPSNWRIKLLMSGIAIFSFPTIDPVFPVQERTPGLYLRNAIDTSFPESGSITIELFPASTEIFVERRNFSPLLSSLLIFVDLRISGAVSEVRFRYFWSSEKMRTGNFENPALDGAIMVSFLSMIDTISWGETTSKGTKVSGTLSGISITRG